MSLGGEDNGTLPVAATVGVALSEMGGRYVLEERLGSGGMGEVYAAYDKQLDRRVALKFLHVRDEAVASRLLDEARAQARIDHPRIRKVYEVGTIEGRPYIAMQLLAGETLAKAGAKLPFDERLRLLLDASRALSVAHQAGLLHLDLKPANLFVERHGDRPQIWIMDFGLARRAGQAPTGEVRGTPRYMAPEQLRGASDQFGPQTDVYSLGVTLFEVLTGKTPREMGDASHMTQSRSQSSAAGAAGAATHSTASLEVPTSPETPSQTTGFVLPPATTLDPTLRTIIERCLQPSIAARYPTAEALAADLEAFLAGEPIAAARPATTPFRRIVRTLRQRRRRVGRGAAIVAALLLLVWGGFALYDARRLAQATDRFLREANEAENRLRLGHVRPVHDLVEEEEPVRRWNAQLLAELPTLPPAARPPAQLALGRSFLLLGDPTAAVERLSPLWQSGYRTPAVALALGTALARRYEEERAALEPFSREGHTQRAEERLIQLYRDPALAMLRQVSSMGGAGSLDLVEGEMALLEERYDEALARAERALQKNPTLYDGYVLQGRVRHAQAIDLYFKDQIGAANRALVEARRAVAAAIEHARSYPPAYVLHCRLAYLQINLDYWGSGHLDLQRAATDLDLCRVASAVAPSDALSHEWLARLAYKMGRAERDRNLVSTPLLLSSVINAEVATQKPRASAGAFDALSNALSELAAALHEKGYDVDQLYERALIAGRRASKLSPGNVIYLYDHALTLAEYAEWKNVHGQDPRPSLQQGIEALRRAVEIDPSQMVRLALVELYVQRAAADNAVGAPADGPLQNAWAALRDAYPQPADTSLYHAITAELLSESARIDWERGHDPLIAINEQLAHLARCQALSPDEPSYRVLEAQARHLLAERNFVYTGAPTTELQRAQAILAARPAEAADILWPQTTLQIVVTEAEWGLAKTDGRVDGPTVSIAPMLSRGRAALAAALAINPNDTEVNLLAGHLDMLEGRSRVGAARLASLRSAERLLQRTVERNPRPLHGWLLLAECYRRQASELRGASADDAIAAARRALTAAEGIAPDHPRLLFERTAVRALNKSANRDELRHDLEQAQQRNKHLAWRYAWLDKQLKR